MAPESPSSHVEPRTSQSVTQRALEEARRHSAETIRNDEHLSPAAREIEDHIQAIAWSREYIPVGPLTDCISHLVEMDLDERSSPRPKLLIASPDALKAITDLTGLEPEEAGIRRTVNGHYVIDHPLPLLLLIRSEIDKRASVQPSPQLVRGESLNPIANAEQLSVIEIGQALARIRDAVDRLPDEDRRKAMQVVMNGIGQATDPRTRELRIVFLDDASLAIFRELSLADFRVEQGQLGTRFIDLAPRRVLDILDFLSTPNPLRVEDLLKQSPHRDTIREWIAKWSVRNATINKNMLYRNEMPRPPTNLNASIEELVSRAFAVYADRNPQLMQTIHQGEIDTRFRTAKEAKMLLVTEILDSFDDDPEIDRDLVEKVHEWWADATKPAATAQHKPEKLSRRDPLLETIDESDYAADLRLWLREWMMASGTPLKQQINADLLREDSSMKNILYLAQETLFLREPKLEQELEQIVEPQLRSRRFHELRLSVISQVLESRQPDNQDELRRLEQVRVWWRRTVAHLAP